MQFAVKGGFVQIDEQDYPLVSSYRWCLLRASKHVVYAQAKVNGRNVTMHRLIMAAPAGSDVDHINRDGLDNRRQNMRLCSRAENLRNKKRPSNNTSGFKGVSRVGRKWKAAIGLLGSVRSIGRFDSREEAYEAYCHAAKSLHGEFHRLA